MTDETPPAAKPKRQRKAPTPEVPAPASPAAEVSPIALDAALPAEGTPKAKPRSRAKPPVAAVDPTETPAAPPAPAKPRARAKPAPAPSLSVEPPAPTAPAEDAGAKLSVKPSRAAPAAKPPAPVRTGARAVQPKASDLPPGALEAIAEGRHGDPFAVLGPHKLAQGLWEIRAVLPPARALRIRARDGKLLAQAERQHGDGVFTARFSSRERPDYRLEAEMPWGMELLEDPYRFGPLLDDAELDDLRNVGSDAVYRRLGAHAVEHEGVPGLSFAIWAPNARRVSVVGDFNGWDGRRHPMRRHASAGVWEIFIPHLARGERYKFELLGADGNLLPQKADPVAFAAERPPQTASIAHGLPDFAWSNDDWLQARAAHADLRYEPVSIYEVHLGSWARVGEEGERYLTYRELAERLIPYVKQMGFTHIELLPITEHPFDGSWGYQPVSLFAPTSRFGSPEDFKAFVEAAHAEGIGVLLDWVPGHFPIDAHGFGLLDGTHVYEHADPRQGFHQDWGTYIYNFGRDEVRSFLTANARFWLEKYRLDGLRVDAVASMLYLDYSRRAGEWIPNRYGGNENLEAIDFLQRMNEVAYRTAPGVLQVAEESTAWPGVSKPTYLGGLGFGFKWNMGWMHDTLHYMQEQPVHRRYHHHNLTFGMVYAWSENFILPLSHDEVVHGKGSLIGKMPGDDWQKFANLRAYFGFMWGHPGKKLLFMGGEIAQWAEWNHNKSLDWHLLDSAPHAGMQALVRDLNHLYRATPALYEQDCGPEGFQWIVSDDVDHSVIAFLRIAKDGGTVLVVCNFTPVPRENYRLGLPHGGWWSEVLNTDAEIYGGSNLGNGGGFQAVEAESHSRPFSAEILLPPLSTLVFKG